MLAGVGKKRRKKEGERGYVCICCAVVVSLLLLGEKISPHRGVVKAEQALCCMLLALTTPAISSFGLFSFIYFQVHEI
jgi:hypothetical protein